MQIFCDEKKAAAFATNAGSPLREIYKEKVNDDGSIELVIAGYEDVDALIQAEAESCDIHYILDRFRNGDLEALNVRKGVYGDFTETPKTYAEALQLQIDAKAAFERLSPEFKKKFNNDPNQFLASAGTEEWYKNLGVDQQVEVKADQDPVESE